MYKREHSSAVLYCKSQTRSPDVACGPHPHPLLPGNLIPIDCQAEKVWGYSHKARQGCLKQGAQVQIVFYKSPLRGICVYPWPLICCWGSLGKREKREWRGTPNRESETKTWSSSFCWTSRELSWGKEGQLLFCFRTSLESITAGITVRFHFLIIKNGNLIIQGCLFI